MDLMDIAITRALGGEGGGNMNYAQATNKPAINGHELAAGANSLSSIGVYSRGEVDSMMAVGGAAVGSMHTSLGVGYFTGASPGVSASKVYGNFGKLVPCEPGETIYTSWTPGSANMAKAAYIYSAMPEKNYGALTGQLGTIDADDDNAYTIPEELTAAVCVFFPVIFAGIKDYTESAGSAYIEETYGKSSLYQAQDVAPSVLPFYYTRHQAKNFLVDDDANSAFCCTLLRAVSDLPGANVAVLGDSLTEQSAGFNGDHTEILFEADGWLSRIKRRYMLNTWARGVGMQMWFCNSSRPSGATDAVQRLLDSGFAPDYIILEYGTNDIRSYSSSFGSYSDAASKTTETTAAAMRWCIETLQEEFPSAKILVVMPCMHNGGNGAPPAAQATYYELANQILDDYAVQRVDMAHESGIVYAMMGNTDGIHLAVPPSGGSGYDNSTVAVEKYSRAIESALLRL